MSGTLSIFIMKAVKTQGCYLQQLCSTASQLATMPALLFQESTTKYNKEQPFRAKQKNNSFNNLM